MAKDSIVILGCGIIGLQVATVLAELGYGGHMTIVAAHFPGDTSIQYTSPWAGANFSAISGTDDNALRWDQQGYRRLMHMSSNTQTENYIRKTPSIEYWDVKPDESKIASMSTYLEDFRVLEPAELLAGVEFGVAFTTVTLNAPEHCRYLFQRLRKEFGVHATRRKLPNLDAAFLSSRTKIVFNCVGNAARSLSGVMDSKCYPTRGQILLTRAPQMQRNVMRHGKDYETYVIPRPASNGNVILGGFMQKHVDTGDTSGAESEDIWRRTSGLATELNASETQILGAFSGLRPSREGGARVERENQAAKNDSQRRIVVHNYGAGGTGFQAGYGMAVEAVDAARDVLEELNMSQRASL